MFNHKSKNEAVNSLTPNSFFFYSSSCLFCSGQPNISLLVCVRGGGHTVKQGANKQSGAGGRQQSPCWPNRMSENSITLTKILLKTWLSPCQLKKMDTPRHSRLRLSSFSKHFPQRIYCVIPSLQVGYHAVRLSVKASMDPD